MARAARTPALPVAESTDNSFDMIADAFKSALGTYGAGSVKIFKKGNDGRFAYLSTQAIADGDTDAFIEKLRGDYPRGGEFQLKLCNEKGQIVTSKTLILAALPDSEASQNNQNGRRIDGQNNDMLLAIMNMQNSSNQMMMQAMMQSSQQNMQMMTGMISAIVPALSGNKGESASQMLSSIIDAQARLNPPREEASSLEKTLDLIGKVRSVLPDGMSAPSDDGGGFGGLLKMALPLVTAAVASQSSKPAPAPVQTQTEVNKQLTAPVAPPVAHEAPQTATTQDEMTETFMLQYGPIMKQIKALLNKGADIERIIDYVLDQIDAEALSEEQFLQLANGIKEAPQLIAPTLGLFGITDALHIAIITDAIPIIADQLENGDSVEGEEGDNGNPSDNGGDGSGIVDNAASKIDGDSVNVTA